MGDLLRIMEHDEIMLRDGASENSKPYGGNTNNNSYIRGHDCDNTPLNCENNVDITRSITGSTTPVSKNSILYEYGQTEENGQLIDRYSKERRRSSNLSYLSFKTTSSASVLRSPNTGRISSESDTENISKIMNREGTQGSRPQTQTETRTARPNIVQDDTLNANHGTGKGGRRKGRHSKRTPVIVDTLLEQKTQRKPTRPDFVARFKFKKVARWILILLKWISAMQDDEDGDQISFDDIAKALRDQRSDIAFDLDDYKSKKEIQIGDDVKHVLGIPPSLRTPEQIQQVLNGLQHIRSFADYPVHMQEKLAKIAYLQQVSSNKVIIREGHMAEHFYFLLNGTAIVNELETKNNGRKVTEKTGKRYMKIKSVLNMGAQFGEEALLYNQLRKVTVISRGVVQLMVIRGIDYFDIFLGNKYTDEIPDYITFLKSLDFMKDWPVENILEEMEQCRIHFFKRGVLMVQNSLDSDWLYIIKSGTCQVMKEIKGMKPIADRKKVINKTKDTVHCIPKLGTCEQAPKVDTGRKRSYTDPTAHASRHMQQLMNEYEEMLKRTKGKLPPVDHGPLISRMPTTLTDFDNESALLQGNERITSALKGERGAHFVHSPVSSAASRQNSFAFDDTTGPSGIVKEGSFLSMRNETRNRVSNMWKDVAAKAGTTVQLRQAPKSKYPPVHVQVELLKPKDVFGLGSLRFEYDFTAAQISPVSLVSRGTECIMLRKSYFLQHSNSKVQQSVKQQVTQYPTEDMLQNNLQTKEDWRYYKQQLIKDIISKPKRKT